MIESVKMAQYYSNAYLTLAAGCAADSRDGFLTKRLSAPAGPCRLDYTRPDVPAWGQSATLRGSVLACLPSSEDVGPLEKRAWTYQESILSRRTLVYGKEQLMFRCEQARFNEAGMSLPWRQTYTNSNQPIASSSSSIPAQIPIVPERKAVALRRWYSILGDYTTRAMRDPNDKLTAISGIAQSLHETLQCRYLFGLWETDMIRGLLWTDNLLLSPKERAVALRRPETYRAPSWSWASVDGPIHVTDTERLAYRYHNPDNVRVKILAIDIAMNSFDPIRDNTSKTGGAELKLQGFLKHVQRSTRSVSQYSFRSPFINGRIRKNHEGNIFLLEPMTVPVPEEIDLNIVGVAFFDVHDEGLTSFWCTRLTFHQGLLLSSDGNGCYRRIGFFAVEDETWFDQGTQEEFILV